MAHAALVDAFARVFELSRVTPEETVAIVTDGPPAGPYVEVAETALAQRGVACFRLDLSASTGNDRTLAGAGSIGDLLSAHPGALAALREVDFVLDLFTTRLGGLIHDRSRERIAEAGTRMLHVNEPAETLLRLVPTPELRERVLAAADVLRAGRELHVTSAAGTDFRVDMTGAAVNTFYGFADQPSQAASWPGGFVAGYPVSGTASGTVVLAPGDVNLTTMRYVERPVTLRWEQDHIRAIEGDGYDAAMLRDYMAIWDEPDAYGLSHVGWGLNRDAHWWAMGLQHPVVGEFTEGRSFAGSFMISTGVNKPAGRWTRCHFDLPMRNCTIALDGVEVVREGVLVEPAAAAGAAA